jgi:MFS family permease
VTALRQHARKIALDTKPLRHPAYRRMWIGSGFSFFGFQFTAVAVPVEMFDLTHDSFWVGLLGVASLVPLLVFALWGGAVADAMDRRVLLLVGSCVTWSSTLGLLVQVLLGADNPYLLLGLAVAAAGLAHQLWLAVALLAVAGCADLVSAVYRQTMLQLLAPDAMRGRLQGVFTAVVAGGPRLGDLRAGAMAAVWGTTVSWVSGGVAAAAVAVVVAAAFPALLRYSQR